MLRGFTHQPALRNRQLWIISTASSIRSIGFGASWPFMAIFFNQRLGVPTVVVGIMFTLLALISTIFSLIGGSISDAIGRKKVILLGAGYGIVIYSLISFFIFDFVSLLVVAELFIFSAISGSLVFPSASALVADVTKPEDRMISYSLYRILANLGWAIGPVSGSYVQGFGMQYIFILLAVASVAQFLIVLLFIREPAPKREKGRKLIQIGYDRYLIVFGAGTFFGTLLASQFSVTLPLYAVASAGIQEYQLGYLYAINGAVVVLGQYPMSYLMRRFNDVHTLMIGSAFYSLGYFLVGISPSPVFLYLDMIVITTGENLTSPGMNSVVSMIAPKGKTGSYMGFLSMVNSSGRAIGPSIGSLFLSIYAYDGLRTWLSLSSFGAVAILLLVIFLGMKGNTYRPVQKAGAAN